MGVVVAYEILVTAQSLPLSLFYLTLGLDLGLGLRLVNSEVSGLFLE